MTTLRQAILSNLLAVAATFGIAFVSLSVVAQTKAPAAADAVEEEREPNKKDKDCVRLPGGNAPVNRLARLKGKLSIRNLELTYFGKELSLLTKDDVEYLAELVPYCASMRNDNTDTQVAKFKMERFAELVLEAQAARAKSVEWIEQTPAAADKFRSSPEGIREIHNFWAEMLNRQYEMTLGDLRYISDYLSRRRDELYSSGDVKRGVLNPFDPRPVIPRDAKE